MKKSEIVLLLSILISPLTIVAAAKPVETEKKRDAQHVKLDHALYKAAAEGRKDDVRDLLKKGANINAPIFEFTPLMVAAWHGDFDTVKLLLELGAKPNLKGNKRRTALMYAADGGYADIVRLLESKGASVFEQDITGDTAADYAMRNGYRELSEYLYAEEYKEIQAQGLSL